MAKVNYSKLAAESYAIDINWELWLSNSVFGDQKDWIVAHCTSANLPTQDIKFDTLNIKGVKSRQVVNIDREGDISLEVAVDDSYKILAWMEKVSTGYVDPETRAIADKKKYQIDSGIQLAMTGGDVDNPKKVYALEFCTVEALQAPDISTGDGAISKCKFNIHYLNWKFADPA